MPRIADALERESRTVDLEQGGFERLLGRRERKQRNRRMRAGALGVIVALAIGTALVRSLTSDPVPVEPPVVPRPAPAPAASGALAYVTDGDVYVADPDGSNAIKIANGLGDNDCASTDGVAFWAEGAMWSPDGRYLAYRRGDCPATKEDWDVVISDAEGNVLGTFPADGWDIGWSPDSTRVAVWDTLFETVGVYGVDGARQAQITMPSGWEPAGDHDPAWLRDGTLAVDAVELPLDGGAARPLDKARAAEWREDYLVTIGQLTFSPDGSHTAYSKGRSLILEGADGSGSVTLLMVEPGAFPSVIGFSPEGDRILFSKDGDGQGRGQRRELWSVGVDGSDARLVVAGTAQGEWFVPSVALDDIPAPPAGSGALAYDLDGDIYVADPNGSNAVKIADGRPEEDCGGDGGEYWAEGTMWSPDGRYLAYRHDTDCSSAAPPWDVVISDTGGNVITTFPAQGWGIAWSPDSTRIAVWDSLYDPPSTIGVYGLDGVRQTQLTMPSGWTSDDNGDSDPVWMPNGTSLRVRNLEMPLDGSAPRQLPLPDAAYSPDGSRVAYLDHWSLVVASADGSDAREVSGPTVLDPVWSPAGDRIAFIYSDKNVYKANELRVLDVATREVSQLVGMDGSWDIGEIQFSPQGDRILISRYGPGADEYGLWSVGVDGSDGRLVVAGTAQGDWLSR